MTAEPSTVSPQPVDLKGMPPEELTEFVVRSGEAPYRARQVLSWLYEKDVSNLDCMTDLPKSWRSGMAARIRITRLEELDLSLIHI